MVCRKHWCSARAHFWSPAPASHAAGSLAWTPRRESREKSPHPRGGRAGVSRRRRAARSPQCVSASRPALSGAPAALRVAPQCPELWRPFPFPARPSGPHRDGASVEQLSRDVERVREARLSPSRGAGASSWSSSPRAGGTDVAGRAPCVSLDCTRACEPSWRAWGRKAGSVRLFRSSPRPRPRPRHGPAPPMPRHAPPRHATPRQGRRRSLRPRRLFTAWTAKAHVSAAATRTADPQLSRELASLKVPPWA